MRVGRATSSAALLVVVVTGAAGGRDLGAGVAGRAALDVAGLAGLNGSVLDRSLSDDRGREGESDGRDQSKDGEELHGCGDDGGATGAVQAKKATGSAGAKDWAGWPGWLSIHQAIVVLFMLLIAADDSEPSLLDPC